MEVPKTYLPNLQTAFYTDYCSSPFQQLPVCSVTPQWTGNPVYAQFHTNKTANEWYLINPASVPVNVAVVPTIFNYKAFNLKMSDTVKKILEVEETQCRGLADIILSEPVTHAYNPLVYAFEPHFDFLQKYCSSNDKHLFVGMNPGPFGMAQNGVPFGEVSVVRDWLGIQGRVYKPLHEHPKRPIWGLECLKTEISGKRLWGLFESHYGQPENFFGSCFVHNYCPMSFMNANGKNVTLPQLPLEKQKMLNGVCDDALIKIISVLNVKKITCIGRYVEYRVKSVLEKYNKEVWMTYMSHPSPLNWRAHSIGWENLAFEQLKNMEVNTITGDCDE